jgi:hypothetical protein
MWIRCCYPRIRLLNELINAYYGLRFNSIGRVMYVPVVEKAESF